MLASGWGAVLRLSRFHAGCYACLLVWATPLPVRADPTPAPARPSAAATQPASHPATLPAEPATQPTEDANPYAGLDHTGTPPGPSAEPQLPPDQRGTDEERRHPRYDGREARPADAGEVLVWIPRALLLPVHVVLEYVIRWPIVQGITLAEKHHVFDRVTNLFSFSDGAGGNGVLFPTLFFDFGISPSMGVFSSYNNIGGSGHNAVFQVGFWPVDWWVVNLQDSFPVFGDDTGQITLRTGLLWRPDFIFAGIGPKAQHSNQAFFAMRQYDAEASLQGTLKDLNRLTVSLLGKLASIRESTRAPSVETIPDFDVTDPSSVPGWEDSYGLIELRGKLELDSRDPDRAFSHGTGLRLDFNGALAMNPASPQMSFFRWIGEVDGFWDVSGSNHVLALRFVAGQVVPIGDETIPLTELISAGGTEYLRGFLEGRWRGYTALGVSTSYRYPIWTFLDAELFATLGNVFNEGWKDLHIKNMVMSWGLALRTNTSRDVSFDIMIGFGTNQIDNWSDDFAVDSVRFTFGVNQGF